MSITNNDIAVTLNQLIQIFRTVTVNNNTTLPLLQQGAACCISLYSLGAVHDLLADQGQFAVSGICGVLVQIVTDVPSSRDMEGNPPYLWNRGWVTINDGHGMIDEKRLTRTDQIWLPANAGMATEVKYWLELGLVVRITELVPA